jgi:hypothetical protein
MDNILTVFISVIIFRIRIRIGYSTDIGYGSDIERISDTDRISDGYIYKYGYISDIK